MGHPIKMSGGLLDSEVWSSGRCRPDLGVNGKRFECCSTRLI